MTNTKRALAIILALAMLMSCGLFANAADAELVIAPNSQSFPDMPDDWSTESLIFNIAEGIITGYDDGALKAGKSMTRAEMAAIINRAFGATVTTDISFEDVNEGSWFYSEIAKAVNMGSFLGTGASQMNPNDSIRREDVFLAFARVMVLSGGDKAVLDKFNDADEIDSWAVDAVATLVEKGYIEGDNTGRINPRGNMTRAEFSQFIYNIFKTYFTESGVYAAASVDGSVMIRGAGVTIQNMTINGDLVLGDGVGIGDVNISNVVVKGRILCRGGEGKVTLTNTSVTESIVVNDVNGTVNFNNFRTENVFADVFENTAATYLTPSTTPSGGGGGGSGTTTYTVSFNYNTRYTATVRTVNIRRNAEITEASFPTDMYDASGRAFAGWYDADGVRYEAGMTISQNVILFDKWYNNETLAADVTFRHVNGSNVMSLSSVEINRDSDTMKDAVIDLVDGTDFTEGYEEIVLKGYFGTEIFDGYHPTTVHNTNEYDINNMTRTLAQVLGSNLEEILMDGVKAESAIYTEYLKGGNAKLAIDKIISDVVDNNYIEVKFDISNTNYWAAVKGFRKLLSEMTFDEIKDKISSKYLLAFSETQLEALFNRTKTDLLGKIDVDIAAVNADNALVRKTDLTVTVNPITDIYANLISRIASQARSVNATAFASFVETKLAPAIVFGVCEDSQTGYNLLPKDEFQQKVIITLTEFNTAAGTDAARMTAVGGILSDEYDALVSILNEIYGTSFSTSYKGEITNLFNGYEANMTIADFYDTFIKEEATVSETSATRTVSYPFMDVKWIFTYTISD